MEAVEGSDRSNGELVRVNENGMTNSAPILEVNAKEIVLRNESPADHPGAACFRDLVNGSIRLGTACMEAQTKELELRQAECEAKIRRKKAEAAASDNFISYLLFQSGELVRIFTQALDAVVNSITSVLRSLFKF